MMKNKEEEKQIIEDAIEKLCESSSSSAAALPGLPEGCSTTGSHNKNNHEDDPTSEELGSIIVDEVIDSISPIILKQGSRGRNDKEQQHVDAESMKRVEDCFKAGDDKRKQASKDKEFALFESFILTEQSKGRSRRSEARKLQAGEEKRLASDLAQLKGFRLQSHKRDMDEDLRRKISEAERAYVSRKMAFAKSYQVASSDCRLQFVRVRAFLKKIHALRQEELRQEHRRTLQFQELVHRLRGTEERVVSLDRQITNRLYQKKKADLNEKHMAQTLEEGFYLESMMDVVNSVQTCKESAARELFELHVENLKAEKKACARRAEEFDLFVAAGTLEMAKVTAHYVEEDAEDTEQEARVQENVQALERKKDYDALPGNTVMAVSKLCDTVLWSVATNDLLLSSSDDSSFYSFEDDEEEELEAPTDCVTSSESDSQLSSEEDRFHQKKQENQPVKQGYSVSSLDSDGQEDQHRRLTPPGNIHTKQVARRLRAKERALTKKHEEEVKRGRREYRAAVRSLKSRHQGILDELLEKGLLERANAREAINQRMTAMLRVQDETTEQLRRKDVKLMKEALRAEDQRLRQVEKSSFAKAQEVISAQVFHEVRNALSSVIAMSEITFSLRKDSTVSPGAILATVDDMMVQIKDVVNYALKMLNDTLNICKMNSGAFAPKSRPFNVQDVVARATRMQLSKASHIKMSFVPLPQSCIAVGDCDIVERIIATLISNAVKFTSSGAVQPFVWPLEDVMVSPSDESTVAGTQSRDQAMINESSRHEDDNPLSLANPKMTMMAIGVADTGSSGLSKEMLQSCQSTIHSLNSKKITHGAQNTGFGLYHAHLQAKALGTNLRLSTLQQCQRLMNKDMLEEFVRRKKMLDDEARKSDSLEDERYGTVVFLAVPIFKDGANALQELKKTTAIETHLSARPENTQYIFQPQPSSSCESFRILVADDVLMLRKGMVHTVASIWRKHFPHCPVSIYTACSAEDMLRSASIQPFDLILCDHLFNHDDLRLNSLTSDELESGKRPCIRLSADSADSREVFHRKFSSFFEDERFSLEEGDGSLLGADALMQLAEARGPHSPAPVLMLVSGHKIGIPPNSGIIVAQKPLKQSEFITLMESHATQLLSSDQCTRRKSQDGDILVSTHGSQMFVYRSTLEGNIADHT